MEELKFFLLIIRREENKGAKLLSHVWLFATPWTVACQALLSMEFCRQEYWSGKSFPSPGYFPNSWIKLRFPSLQEDSLPYESPGKKAEKHYWEREKWLNTCKTEFSTLSTLRCNQYFCISETVKSCTTLSSCSHTHPSPKLLPCHVISLFFRNPSHLFPHLTSFILSLLLLTFSLPLNYLMYF